MKKIGLILAVTGALLSTAANAQSISEACGAVKMKCDYNSRYDLVDLVYAATGQVLFDKQSNKYTRNMEDQYVKSEPPRFYIGQPEQNAKLSRNILANRNLFRAGKLDAESAKKWKMVK